MQGTPAVSVYVADTSNPICAQLHARHDQLGDELRRTEKALQAATRANPGDRGQIQAFAAYITSLQKQIAALEKQQTLNGCTPG